MKNKALIKISLTAIMAALTAVATYFAVPSFTGHGYINFGDTVIIIGAVWLGPAFGGVAAAIGSTLSDILLGYFIYAPATFIIKLLVAVIAAVVFEMLSKANLKKTVSVSVAAICAEAVMILGYFLFEWVLYGIGVAAYDIIANGIQAVASIVLAIVVFSVIGKRFNR